MTTRTTEIDGQAAVSAFLQREHGLLIDGQWVAPASAGMFEVIDPGTGGVLTRAASGQEADVDRAVAAARRSFESGHWRDKDAAHRAAVLYEVADGIEDQAGELSLLEALDTGMPLKHARGQVQTAVDCFRYYAGLLTRALQGHTSEIASDGLAALAYTLREPCGVAGLIIPWNVPIRMAAWKLAPALAAGCSCVLKPAEQAPLTPLRLGDIMLAAGVPDGVVNIVTGYGETAGRAIACHGDIDKVSFTGSTEVGREIVRAAASNLKRLTLELGGKSPMIVCDDADLAVAVPAVALAIFGNSGQVCSAGSRAIIHADVHNEVVDGVAEIGRRLKLGYCTDRDADLGPLISAAQLDRVRGYVESGRADGAEVVSGGHVRNEPGYFFEPTVLAGTTSAMRAVREEIFGPVLCTTSFTDLGEAIAMANDTDYGLAASVFTRDIARAHSVAKRLRAGRVGINAHAIAHLSMPGGGYKQSGWGRETGPYGIEPYLETKAVFTVL
jgi:phenylacetaldehyde dehydrogenase